ncbi:putative cellulose synthase (UDP-forming) [Helianthus annuus]|nr:putative cellulose synthase (UDP-forming) [Helianthus annuus]
MAINIQDSNCLPLQEKIVHSNKMARAIELIILSFLVAMLVYRVIFFKDQNNSFPWLLALVCELWFTFTWILSMCIKWNQCSFQTYPDRLLKRVNEIDFPAVDIFVTTADPILEPSIITMNTVLSLLAVDYPLDKLALYLSDDSCSPLTFYSIVETTKFAKLWVLFCKTYNIQVRAPFRYFTSTSTPLENDSLEFKHEWKKMKVVYWKKKLKPKNYIILYYIILYYIILYYIILYYIILYYIILYYIILYYIILYYIILYYIILYYIILYYIILYYIILYYIILYYIILYYIILYHIYIIFIFMLFINYSMFATTRFFF